MGSYVLSVYGQSLQPHGNSEWIQEQVPVCVRSQTMESGLEKVSVFLKIENFMEENLHAYVNP